MRKVCISVTLLFILVVNIPVYAQGPGEGGPLGIRPMPLGEDEKQGFVKAETAKESETKKATWFEKQLSILSLAEKKNVFQEKSIGNVYKRMKDQADWNKNYTLQKFIEMSTKAKEIGNMVSSYGEHLILQKDGSYIRFYDGRPTDIFNQTEKDNYGNIRKINLMNIQYSTRDQFVVDYDTTNTHLMQYVRLEYDPEGAINYLKFEDAKYLSNISGRPSQYTTTEGAVEQTAALELSAPADTKTAKELYDKIISAIIPSVESELVYKVTTAFSNINYYNLSEDTATKTAAGGVYGEKKSYDYTLTGANAPDAPQTGTVSGIEYYLLDKKYMEPLAQYWWHAQDATLNNLHPGQEPKEASSHTTVTALGITKEIDFYDAGYDGNNSLINYRQTEKINGTETNSYYYHDINYDTYGRKISYTADGNTYGLSYTDNYQNIKYDALSRVISYDMNEIVDGVTTSYKYWDMTYNNLWQLSDYYYSINGMERHRSSITYNSYGLVASYTDVSVSNGVTTTTYRVNTYNTNGLLSEYTEETLIQGGSTREYDYTWAGNITYNSIYAITSFDRITIVDTNATTITNYASKIPAIVNALTFNGVGYTLSTMDMIGLGFNSTTTVYTEKWQGLGYYSVGESRGSNYYNFTLDTFRGRLKSYGSVLRTTTTTSDSAVVTIL